MFVYNKTYLRVAASFPVHTSITINCIPPLTSPGAAAPCPQVVEPV